ncbi:glycosyltransferase family 9 protein [soil metagenome]
MRNTPEKILIIQTAFLGDLILSLPMIDVLKQNLPGVKIDILCIPFTSGIIKNDKRINEIIIYDKRGKDKGVSGFQRIVKKLKENKYDVIISPHRSFRSALMSFLSQCKITISFDTSAGAFLYKYKVKYRTELHEIKRDLALLEPLFKYYSINYKPEEKIILPEIFTSVEDKLKIDNLFSEYKIQESNFKLVIAPGTVWNTKQYPKEYFVQMCKSLSSEALKIFLTGGINDVELSDFIKNNSENPNIVDVTGKLTLTESTELIKRCNLLITNDSAPLHIGSSQKVRTFAIFGATVPEFGFYPLGESDKVYETKGLSCRPCSIHGSNKCPIGTFVCMKNIDPLRISAEIVLAKNSKS